MEKLKVGIRNAKSINIFNKYIVSEKKKENCNFVFILYLFCIYLYFVQNFVFVISLV